MLEDLTMHPGQRALTAQGDDNARHIDSRQAFGHAAGVFGNRRQFTFIHQQDVNGGQQFSRQWLGRGGIQRNRHALRLRRLGIGDDGRQWRFEL